jgi:lipoprotein-anchoring transpeptidase ErfK/SrfK
MRFARVFGTLATLLVGVGSAAAQQRPNEKLDTASTAATMDSINQRLRAVVAKGGAELLPHTFTSSADSAEWARAKRLAESSRDLRIIVSLNDRTVSLVYDTMTLMRANAAVASGMTLDYAGHSWTFKTPRGKHRVVRKMPEPVWTPPEWAYAEVAHEYGLKLERLERGKPVTLEDGSRLVVRDSVVGLMLAGSTDFAELPTDEHVVFDETLYIPPIGTANRRVSGELGHFALDLGDGYMIHGTPHPSSIGRAITHGCIRLSDADIQWLYEVVPEGTPVYIY